MKLADTVRGLLKRWYILFPGLLIAGAIALGAWFAIPPGYNRSATQLMVPGGTSIPQGGNPYLYLGGLAPAADVLVRAVGSANTLNDVAEKYPGIEIEISRDTTTAGPIILITVTAKTDAAAENVLTMLIDRTATVLDELQAVEAIPEANRMTVIPVTVDEQSVEQSRSRFVTAAGVGIVGTVITLIIASLAGASRRRDRDTAVEGEPADPDSPDVDGGSDTAQPATGQFAQPEQFAQPPQFSPTGQVAQSVPPAQFMQHVEPAQPAQVVEPRQPDAPPDDPSSDVPVSATAPRARVKW